MVRIAHIADIHLDVVTYGVNDPATGMNTRLMDYIRTWEWTVSEVLHRSVEIVVIAGDIFHVRRPSLPAVVAFIAGVQRLLAAGVEVVLYPGNHDRPATTTEQGVWQLLERTLPGAHVAVHEAQTYVFDLAGGRTTVSVVPSFGRSGLLTSDDLKGLGPIEANAAVATATLAIARDEMARAQQANPDGVRLLSLHCAIDTARTSTEQTLSLRDEVVLRLDDLAAISAAQAVLLGHIHKPQVLRGSSPWVGYPGSIERAEFPEADEAKGFYVLDCSPDAVVAEHVATPARVFQPVTVRLEGDTPEAIEAAVQQIRAAAVDGAIVRVRAFAPESAAGKLDAAAIAELLQQAGAHKVTGVDIEVDRAERVRDSAFAESLSTREALTRWLAQNVDDPARRERLERLGDDLAGGDNTGQGVAA